MNFVPIFRWRETRFSRIFPAMFSVRRRLLAVAPLVIAFAGAALAESPTKSPQASPAFKSPRAEPLEAQRGPEPRALAFGQPFDDREVSLYLESEGRKLFANNRCGKLTFDRHSCSLTLPDAREE